MSDQKNKLWIWTAVDHFRVGILDWVIGDHSSETFKLLWQMLRVWRCYFWVTDDWPQMVVQGLDRTAIEM